MFTFSEIIKYAFFNTFAASEHYGKYCESIKYVFTTYPGIEKICRGLAEHMSLIYRDDNNDDNNTKIKDCRYLFYWMHEQVVKIKKHNKNTLYYWYIHYLIEAWKYMNKILDKSNSNVCNLEYYDTNNENIKKRKMLYDYCENYNYLQNDIFTGKYCDSYYYYLKKIDNLYNNFKEVWSVNNGNIPEYIKDCEKNKPSDLLQAPSCRNVERLGENVKINESYIYDWDEGFEYLFHFPPSSDDSYGVVYTMIPILGIFFFFLLLYKFTPVGSILRSLLLRKKITQGAIDNNEIEILSSQSDIHTSKYLYNSNMNIGYTS
ncbi:PIR Superfamily Protein [Plasmodium ovale wallikeri]|uniref:PIR Superfamily Protein n=1 Tax=Plasmodium ovale wallikeri TaxID=864142 RepID=A0A1A9ATD8_PLAOA|nr:PIR Superfamily Protein [Plasmodium ovale wallikeri]